MKVQTAGGTQFVVTARVGGDGLDPQDAWEDYCDAHPDLVNEDREYEFPESAHFAAFQQRLYDRRIRYFEETALTGPEPDGPIFFHDMVAGVDPIGTPWNSRSVNISFEMTRRGKDYIEPAASLTGLPAFEW